MNVKELKELLDNFNDNDEIRVSYNFGDYGRTEVAANLEGADLGRVVYSEYHSMDRVVSDDSESDAYEADEIKQVLILRV